MLAALRIAAYAKGHVQFRAYLRVTQLLAVFLTYTYSSLTYTIQPFLPSIGLRAGIRFWH
jgi:hypothetical protein